MKHTTKTLFATTITAALSVCTAQAEQIAVYNFTGSSFASSDSSTVTASDLAVGAGLTADGANTTIDAGFGNTAPAFKFRYAPIGGNDEDRFDADTVSLTVTPAGGDTLDFTSITFDLINISGSAGITATVYSTVIDGTIDDATNDKIGDYATAGGAGSWEPVSFDLSAYTGKSGSQTFVINFWTNGNNGVHNNYIDNIIVNATVVPEPTSLALLGLGGLALVRRRR